MPPAFASPTRLTKVQSKSPTLKVSVLVGSSFASMGGRLT